MYKPSGKQNNQVGDKVKQMIIIQVVSEKKNGKKKAFVNNHSPPFNFRKAAEVSSSDQINMLGKPAEENIFIPYVQIYLNSAEKA